MSRKNAPTLHFLPQDVHCAIGENESVLEVALHHGLPLSHSCGGMGSCTTCRVWIEHSPIALPPRNELEEDLATMRGFAENERLACQLPALEGLVIRVPDTLPESDFERT